MIKPIKFAVSVRELQKLLNFNFSDLEDRKVDKSEGQGLSTNDFSDFYKSKLDGIEANAQVNIIESITIDGASMVIDSNKNIDIHQPKYSIVESSAPGEKSFKEYNLTIDGEATGMTVVVPKDIFLSKGYLKKVTALDEPYSGAKINDAYLQLDLNDSDIPSVYISLTGLQYHEGQDIVIDEGNVISTVIPIPRKISELENDNFTVTDENYVHTDNNFTDEYISKITNLEIEVDSNFSELDGKITSLDSKVNTNKTETDTKIQENYDDLNNKINSLEAGTGVSLANIETAISNLNNTKADKATTLAGYNISDAYTKTEVDAKVSSVYRVRGSVATYDDLIALPQETLVIGDVYNVEESGSNYVWIGTEWDKLSETVDLTPYLTKESASQTYATITVVNGKVDKVSGKSLVADTEIARLATLKNYDDTEVKSDISTLQSSVTNITTKLDGKVDKVSGKSLVADTEIARLATLKNYDDTEVKSDISTLQSSKQDKLVQGENITISGNTISSSTTWGGIEGDIQNQTDLKTNYATVDLDNITDSAQGKFDAVDVVFKGKKNTNPEAYQDVLALSHSTFDLSKFEVVGSPTITDDGIASGFTASNYIVSKDNIVIPSTAKKIEVGGSFVVGETSSVVQQFYVLSSLRAEMWGDLTRLSFFPPNGLTGNFYIDGVFKKGDFIQYIYTIDLTTNMQKVDCYINGVLKSSRFTAEGKFTGINAKIITCNLDYSFKGNINVRDYSIKVDGIPVFNGNKTGLDIIKEDNYEVVGSPTITEDGILTNYSTSDYLQKNVSISENEIIVKFGFKILKNIPIGANSVIFKSGNTTANISIDVRNVGDNLYVASYLSDGTVNGYVSPRNKGSLALNTAYTTECIYNISNYTNTCKLYKDGILFDSATYKLPSALTNWTSITNFLIGWVNTAYVSIDLNSIKIYSNGNLVYQPCLKIPYTLSKTGSKIVDVAYLSRVQDLAEQKSNALYTVLDQNDVEFYPPMIQTAGVLTNLDNEVKTINVSKMYETGAVSKDVKGFEELLKRAHSSFDLSKFEVVGSPTITDDGIASGFSLNDYLTFTCPKISRDIDWEIVTPIFTPKVTTLNQYGASYGNNTQGRIFVQFLANGKKTVFIQHPSEGDIIRYENTLYQANSSYQYKITHTKEGLYTVYLSENGEEFTPVSSATNTNITFDIENTTCCIGKNYIDNINPFTGSIDLKSVAVWADGIPVFNGNKTGLEIIKPDNYEIVGSPTITEDGIASGFSDSNYIAKENVFSLNENGDFHIDFKFDSEIYSSIQYFIDIYNSINDEIIIRREANGNIYTCICFVDGSSVFRELLNSRGHNSIEGYIEYKNGTYTFKLNDSLVTRQATKMNALTYKISMGARVASGSIVQPLINGSIDLNSIKIYSNGNLVYQPCLKIPYTEAFKHSRIVDVAYRHRVQDLAEQKGEALYYTIDEQNQNFTLPSADIYGMITKNRDIAEHADLATQTAYIIKCNVTGTTGYVIYSNGLCEQWGTAGITSGTSVTVNLFVPYMSTQFNVQVTDGGNATNSARNSYGFYNPSGAQTIIYGVKVGNAFAWRTIGMVNLDEVLTND